MRNRAGFIAVLAAMTILATLATAVPPAGAASEVLTSQMKPDQVQPRGPQDGRARIALQIDDEKNYVCYLAQWDSVGEPTGLHVHRGPQGTNGPPVIDLRVTEFGDSGCMNAPRPVVSALLADPEGHYVVLRTDRHPSGAVRGQLRVEPD